MENAPVIWLVGFKYSDDPEARKRVQDWIAAAHRPLRRKSPWWIDAHRYLRLGEDEQYPDAVVIWRFDSLENSEKNAKDPNWKAASDDERSLHDKYGDHPVWVAVYELKNSLRNGPVFTQPAIENTLASNAQIIHLSAYNLSSFIQDKYEEWFSHWGYKVFLPIFIKLPGLVGYDFYKFVKIVEGSVARVLEKNYPPFLSILYFENTFALENFKKSKELEAFQKVTQADFSGSLNAKWDSSFELESIIKREE